MYEKLNQGYPAKVKQGRALFQRNASPHTARLTKEKFKQMNDGEILLHPPLYPDNAPSNYSLFRSMAHFLGDQPFNTFNEVTEACFLIQSQWTKTDSVVD